MPDFKKLIGQIFLRFLPLQPRDVLGPIRGEPYRAHLVDADELHGMLREAEAGTPRRLFSLYRDIITADDDIQHCLRTRKLAVLNKTAKVMPIDPKAPEDVAAAAACQAMLDGHMGLLERLGELLDGCLFPVVLMEKTFAPSVTPGLRFDLAALTLQDAQLIDYRLDRLRLERVDPAMRMPNNQFDEVDPSRFIIYRGHLLSAPDNWGGPMRSLLFWWLFSVQDREWWVRFLDRYGAPFLVGRYPTGDDKSRWTLEAAFNAATRLFGITVSEETQVEVKEVSATHGDAFSAFHEAAAKHKARLILGQTLSSDSQPSGLGSGNADLHGEVRHDIETWDGVALGSAIRDQLFRQYLQINGLPGNVPRLVFACGDPKAASEMATTLKTLSDAGFEPTDEAIPGISEGLGIQIRRKAAAVAPAFPPGLPGGLHTMAAALALPSVARLDSVAEGMSAELAQAFRGSYAPLRRIIETSTSPAHLEQQIRLFYADYRPGKLQELIQQGLMAYAASGAAQPAGLAKAP